MIYDIQWKSFIDINFLTRPFTTRETEFKATQHIQSQLLENIAQI